MTQYDCPRQYLLLLSAIYPIGGKYFTSAKDKVTTQPRWKRYHSYEIIEILCNLTDNTANAYFPQMSVTLSKNVYIVVYINCNCMLHCSISSNPFPCCKFSNPKRSSLTSLPSRITERDTYSFKTSSSSLHGRVTLNTNRNKPLYEQGTDAAYK